MAKSDQTFSSFKDKWENNRELAFSETLKEGSDIFNWILRRNGFDNPDAFKQWLAGRSRILDAGCGNGRVTALLSMYAPTSSNILGIDLTAAHVAQENLAEFKNVRVQQKNILEDLSDLGTFDLIYCQEVLHHTSDPRAAFLNLCQRLANDGEIAIYVYKQKAPMREYADDFIRSAISSLPYEQAMSDMREVTELGKLLSELDTKVTVPDVRVLGIEAGEYDVQRLIYHFFLKCFWNPSLSFEDNAAINYDWYHPQLCTRHTLEEVEQWFKEAKLEIIHRLVDHYGITVRGVRPS
ncbi:MAG: class I SAM-dependent methyltransferase [Desulfarculus sp.]|nr:class I SAM-dependent methyltransferase [Pseudomonadota bacterium]MBV1716585.1 class I SAM-dependent methyltransferase [Desulfarculus sp.]MBU4577115.1 class I SAM-dependent methyltransferase [Pseudomonadota bacterium]MBU4597713.1 class I SAM-dependent methyltransferase [Pseudomonadota bacterium]MBV1736761.1 class I SAM-dependent methyltransferase [Desulfarculus sp.]